MTRFCTIITDSYRAHAEVLRASLREHEREDLTIVNIDSGDLPFGIDPRELRQMAAMYTPSQLVGALKPRLVRHLLTESPGVIYLDADTEAFGRFDAALELASRRGVALTPHVLAPSVRFEPWFLRSGMLNSGFAAVTREGAGFLDWWAARTATHAHHAPQDGYFQEQRWLDLTPALFGAGVLRDPGYNMMGWNLHERTTHGLVFFHFCGGFDPHQPGRLATMPNLPWPNPADHPAVAEICRDYAVKLLAAGFDDAQERPYRYGGLDWLARFAYRHALLAGDEPPNPFDEESGFAEWLTEPLDAAGVTRHMLALYAQREDLRGAFPLIPGADSERFTAWLAASPDVSYLLGPQPGAKLL